MSNAFNDFRRGNACHRSGVSTGGIIDIVKTSCAISGASYKHGGSRSGGIKDKTAGSFKGDCSEKTGPLSVVQPPPVVSAEMNPPPEAGVRLSPATSINVPRLVEPFTPFITAVPL